MNTESVKPGQTVQFVYTAGSIPNVERLIVVETVDANHINGQDLAVGEYRSFLKNRVQNDVVELIANENEEVIRPKQFLSNPSTVDARVMLSIFALLFPRRKGARYDTRVNAIVACREDLPRVEIVVGERQTVVDFIGEDGQRVGLSFDYKPHGPSFDVPHRMICPMETSVMAQFAEQLHAHTHLHIGKPQTTVPGWQEHCDKMATAGNPLYAGATDK